MCFVVWAGVDRTGHPVAIEVVRGGVEYRTWEHGERSHLMAENMAAQSQEASII